MLVIFAIMERSSTESSEGAEPEIRVQLCGPLIVDVLGRRVEAGLPRRQGRLLFAYLLLNRHRLVPRDELIDALWGDDLPNGADGALSVLISKTRAALKPLQLEGRGHLRLLMPDKAQIDVEIAQESLHRAEAAIAKMSWYDAYVAGLAASQIADRRFLVECEANWVEDRRRILEDVWIRATESYGIACLEIGGAELRAAERVGAQLVQRSPYRESCHRLLMRAHAAAGNPAEGLRAYEQLRELLRTELGVEPDRSTQHVYLQLLGASDPA